MYIHLTKKQKNSLQKMCETQDCEVGDILQKSLALLQVTSNEIKNGNSVCIIDKNDKIIKQINGIFDG